MTASPGPKPVAETQEVLLVDHFEHGLDGILDDFILQGGYAQRTLASVGLRDPCPLRGLCPVGSAMHSPVEVVNPILQVFPVCVPSHTVHAGGSKSFEFEIAVPEHFRGNMVQQGGKPHLLILLRCFSYAPQTDATLPRLCVRRE